MKGSPSTTATQQVLAEGADPTLENCGLSQLQKSEFDETMQLAAEICGTPLALVTLGQHEQWWSRNPGDPAPHHLVVEAWLSQITAVQANLLLIEDTSLDPLSAGVSLAIGETPLRFLAAMPLVTMDNDRLGYLCVFDSTPRQLTSEQQNSLHLLAHKLQTRIELRAQKKALEEALQEKQVLVENIRNRTATFQAFMDHGPFASYVKDADGRMLFYNKHVADRFGVTQQAWLGRNDHDLWPKHMADLFREADLLVLKNRIPTETIEVAPGADGSPIHWKSYKFPIQHENGEWMLAGISIEITKERERENELEDALRAKTSLAQEIEANRLLMRSFLDNNPNHIYIKDEAGRYISYNAAFAQHYGIIDRAWIGRTDQEVMPEKVANTRTYLDLQVLLRNERSETRDELRMPDGSKATYLSLRFPLEDAAGRRMAACCSVNITREAAQQQALERSNAALEAFATTDFITGLANRRVFEDLVRIEYAAAERNNRPLSIVRMELEAESRDRAGSSASESRLRQVGQVLQKATRVGDIAARLSAGEFGILLPETDAEEAEVLAESIQQDISQIQSEEGKLGVSMGIAARKNNTLTSDHLLEASCGALDEARQTGNLIVVNDGDASSKLAASSEPFGLLFMPTT